MRTTPAFDETKFPKVRPALPPGIREIYESHYRLNRAGATLATSASSRLESWLHRKVASDVRQDFRRRSTLEIGAGTLNQLEYEPDVGPYDIVEPWTALFSSAPGLARIRKVFSDIREVGAEVEYDRITSIATFEHLCDLPFVVARTGMLLTADGTLRIGIPSEGTPLWKLGWKLTTAVEYRVKYGLDYDALMRHEHVNTAAEIEVVLRHFYRDVRRWVFGVSARLSLYQFFECTKPERSRCREYLSAQAAKI